jgi:hypothetical protein
MEPINIFQFEDICFEIAKHLRVIEILGLTCVPGWQFKIPKGWFRKQFEQRLADRGHPASFLDSINESGSVISGSFLLSVLDSVPGSDMTWKSNDIDVYTNEATGPCSHCGKIVTIRTHLSDIMCKCNATECGSNSRYPKLGIVGCLNWELNTDPIN